MVDMHALMTGIRESANETEVLAVSEYKGVHIAHKKQRTYISRAMRTIRFFTIEGSKFRYTTKTEAKAAIDRRIAKAAN